MDNICRAGDSRTNYEPTKSYERARVHDLLPTAFKMFETVAKKTTIQDATISFASNLPRASQIHGHRSHRNPGN
eukprot:391714-Amphidinium_carterae.1